MLQLGSFSACVTIDDRELEQHQVDISKGGTKATCWIASEAGKHFAVKWKDNSQRRQHSTSGCVKLDGVDCGRRIISPGHHNSAKRSYFSTGPSSVRPYMFSHLSLTDDDGFLDAHVSPKLGTIKIELRRVIIKPHRKDTFSRKPPEDQVVHEKMKKLATHCVKFGDEIKRAPKVGTSVSRIDKKPIFTFLFQYKPQALLEADGIAEAPVTNKRKHVKVEPGQKPEVIEIDDSEDERTEPPRRKKIKKEHKRGSLLIPGEVIDLT
ncbi:hypothetical protein FIBSPDRAFT_830271 [Athelia psychrophila]|uniref:DUF7918 domain-containing protein n=1 Tax=Athelia psychrophila TaxID=1759441 RepID=A0A166GCM3_9AGAM|nr:hypothetical protein FIBSPDRAFT_830271 [Fibularhizoctonia sp. CBS 109695]